MPRIARVVVPGLPHHVTQRGNRGVEVFLRPDDRPKYLVLLADYRQRHGLAVWAYCLMADHVHFVAVPSAAESLGRTFRDTHGAYAAWLNRQFAQRGHLWQGRFGSCVLDDAHLWPAVRYVERNPVRAGLTRRAEDWPWSSAAAHCGLRADPLLSPIGMPPPATDWRAYLRNEDETATAAIRRHTTTGRPCGSAAFVQALERTLGRPLAPRKRGPKPRRRKRRSRS